MTDTYQSKNQLTFYVGGTGVVDFFPSQINVNNPMRCNLLSSTVIDGITGPTGTSFMYFDNQGVLSTKISGGISLAVSSTSSRTVVDTSSYNIKTSDNLIGIRYTSTGPCSLLLPFSYSGPTGKVYNIIDESGNAQNNNITITPSGADTLNGDGAVIMNLNYQSLSIYNVNKGSSATGAWYIY